MIDRDIKPDNVPTAELLAEHPELAFACPDCNAEPGARCASLIRACKYLEVSHYKRRHLALTTKKEP